MIPDDVNLTRSGSFDTGYGVLDDATSSEGRKVRIDATRITLISLRLVQQGTQREAFTKFYEIAKSSFIENKNQYL